jgi:hypothetical protein
VSEVETDFLLISHAVARLEKGVFGGDLKRPKPVEAAKKHYPRASIGWGVHKQAAAAAVDAAISAGDLSVYVFAPSDSGEGGCPLQIPALALGRLTRIRGGLPDHAIRPSVALLRNGLVASQVFAALSNSAMYLQQSEFNAWYERQRNRRRWPSQRKSKRARVGRPSKQTDELLTSIRARVEEGSWCAKYGIAKLAKLLVSRGAPKRNTLRRAVDQLYRETGDTSYKVVPRTRSNVQSKNRH